MSLYRYGLILKHKRNFVESRAVASKPQQGKNICEMFIMKAFPADYGLEMEKCCVTLKVLWTFLNRVRTRKDC